ncbi:Smt3-specific protease [Ascosphaera acerosa]|nr:Smt3-specific protease [Ascosphaera acerosa]
MLTKQTIIKKLDWANAAQQEKLVRRRRADASEHAFFLGQCLDQRLFSVSSWAKSGLNPTEEQALKTAQDLVAPFGYQVVLAATGEVPPRRNLPFEERERITRVTAASLDLLVVPRFLLPTNAAALPTAVFTLAQPPSLTLAAPPEVFATAMPPAASALPAAAAIAPVASGPALALSATDDMPAASAANALSSSAVLNAKIGVTDKDYDDLHEPEGWLSDSIIFAYLHLLVGAPGVTASCRYGVLDPGYLHHLYYDEGDDFDLLGSAWMVKVACTSDVLFAPLNVEPGHWVLMAVDLRRHEIVFLDSNVDKDDEDDYIGRLQGWLWDGNALAASVTLRDLLVAGPQQDNDNDCGVFVCAHARVIVRDGRLPLADAFDSNEIDGFRAHMAHELYLEVACLPPGSDETWDEAKTLDALQQGRPAHLGQGFDSAEN